MTFRESIIPNGNNGVSNWSECDEIYRGTHRRSQETVRRLARESFSRYNKLCQRRRALPPEI